MTNTTTTRPQGTTLDLERELCISWGPQGVAKVPEGREGTGVGMCSVWKGGEEQCFSDPRGAVGREQISQDGIFRLSCLTFCK